MIACNGWLDVLIYASTRAEIVFAEYPPGDEVGLETFAFMGKGHKFGNVTTVEAGERVGSRLAGRSHGGDSVENLYGLDQIGVKGEVTISVDVIPSVKPVRAGTGLSESWDGTSTKSSQPEQ